MIAVVDYGAGNLRSVAKALESLGADVSVCGEPDAIRSAEKIILPGVGAFGRAMKNLKGKKLDGALLESIERGKPFLGICLGLQLLFESSEEDPDAAGLSVLPGRVVRLRPDMKVPHLGWNQVRQVSPSPMWEGISDGTFFYFAHSYCVEPRDPSCTAGTTEYGKEFVSAVKKKNVFGIQFHPEKSQSGGLRLLENFAKR